MQTIETARHSPNGSRRVHTNVVHLVSSVFVFLVPLVSFPLFPAALLSTVAPALLYPAAILLIIRCVYMLHYKRASRMTLYVALALAAVTALGIAPLIWRDYSSTVGTLDAVGRYMRSIVTVAIAGVIFLTSFWVVISLKKGSRTFVRLLWAGVALMLVVAILAILTMFDSGLSRSLYIELRNMTSLRPDAPIGSFRRITLLAVEPSFAGLEVTAWWLAFLMAAGVVLRKTWIWILCLIALGVAALTQSLTAVLGALGLAGGLALLFVFRRSLHKRLVCGAVVAACAAPLVWIAGGETVQRPLNRLGAQIHRAITGEMWSAGPADGSLAVRYGLAHTALNVWYKRPLTAAGLGLAGYTFKDHVPDWVYRNPRMGEYWKYVNNPEGTVFPSAKNLYIRLLSEVGLVGTVVFLALLTTLLGRGFRTALVAMHRYRSMGGDHSFNAVLSVAAVLGSCAALAGYNSLDSFAVPYLWVWLGVLEGVRQVMKMESPL